MAEKRINPLLAASKRWQGSSWRGTDGIRMDDRTPRRSSRARLMRVSVTEVELRWGSFPRRLEMEKERRLRSISARAAMPANAAVAQEWNYMKACLQGQVHYFRVRRHPSRTDAKCGDHFLPADFTGLVPPWKPEWFVAW